ncbi:caspase domain-containing protein [Desarmillaria tabescens]|uniref:Caspase domain-containing protein n=1 Tax=Armillaria tabescens TaxID=1929756 RepID=A0AA39TYB3_ARMTA|nr:caspase domain-containing protein [Desarmillaria tabescens]KAK0462975.1 caspase domain-containing protein [Desarmillaria tabescens]
MSFRPTFEDLFALVIGIDNYAERRALTASVLDAKAIVAFLKRIGVPDRNIFRLYDQDATFDGILKGFEALVTRGDIKKGRSSIFIYFSGHGASDYKSALPKSQEGYWSGWNENVIEQICPQDIGSMPGIPDRMVAAWLNKLAKEKSNNIILMLDSCYSAGMTRADDGGQSDDDEFETRTIFDPPPLFFSDEIWSRIPPINETDILTQDQTPSESRPTKNPSGFEVMYNHSHVLLAACSRDSKAQAKKHKGGVFTTAVLEVLESVMARGQNISSISYVSLIEGLHQPIGRLLQSRSGTVRTQFPHCEGSSCNRGIFSPRVVFIDNELVRVTKNGSRIFLSAGYAQGVIPGSEYFAHRDRDMPTASSALPGVVLQVSNIDTFQAELILHGMPLSHFPESSFAKFMRAPHNSPLLNMFCSDSTWIRHAIGRRHDIHWVDHREDAQMELVIDNREITFYSLTPVGSKVYSCESGRIPRWVRTSAGMEENRGRVMDVLRWANRFHYHRNRHSAISGVSLELHVLEKVSPTTRDKDASYTRIGHNLFDKCGQAVIKIDNPNRPFGVTLHNRSGIDYYPYFFAFESDLSISSHAFDEPQFSTVSGRSDTVDCPLPRGSSLTFGCGSASNPVCFQLLQGMDHDITVWKVFLTTNRVDMRSIGQSAEVIWGKKRADVKDPENYVQHWGDVSGTVVQLRKY